MFRPRAHHRVSRREAPEAGALPRPARPQPLRGRDGEVHRVRALRGVCPARCIYVRGADNPPDAPVSPGERYGFVYEINYLRCIHCDLCVEACPTEAITETKLFEFSFAQPRGRDLHEVRAARRRRRPGARACRGSSGWAARTTTPARGCARRRRAATSTTRVGSRGAVSSASASGSPRTASARRARPPAGATGAVRGRRH